MSIHGILKKEKDSCSVCTPIQIFLFDSLVSRAKHAMAKTSFLTYCRQVVLVLGEKKNVDLMPEKKRCCWILKLKGVERTFCPVTKGFMLSGGSTKSFAWEVGGEREVKGTGICSVY